MPEAPALDTLRRVATPEGCELTLRLAGPVVRARAWLIDAVARGIVLALAAFVLSKFGMMGKGLFFVTFFVIANLYPILFEVYWKGQTPGKRLSGLMVLRDDGTPVGWSTAVARNLLRALDALPVGYAAALASIWMNRDGKRLGDLLAGTVVVHVAAGNGKEPGAPEKRYGMPEAPPFALTQAEQRALLEFHRRAPLLTEERAEELALLAEPLTAGLGGAAARARLARIAEYQMGSAKADGAM